MNERIKAALSAKIDSREKFDNILRDLGKGHAIADQTYNLYILDVLYHFPLVTADLTRRMLSEVPHAYWWWVREMMRLQSGVYPSVGDSSVLARMMQLKTPLAYVPHISVKDPSMIAVTMSPDDGARDKQTQIALGKWLRRMYPTMTDATVQQLEAAHRADLCAELEIAHTEAEIREVYTTMRGDTGCMRYDKDYWGLEHHPSVVYTSPGFGVAVVRDPEGNVTGRSVVYVNPDDPQDKRYIRIYGDPVLKRRLERNGYRCAGFAGTQLNAIPTGRDEDTYILPYLDPPGGAASNITQKAHLCVVLRGDKLYPIEAGEWAQIDRALHTRQLPVSEFRWGSSTNVRAYLRPLPDDLFSYQCAITGQTHDSKEHPPVQAWINGEAVTASPQAVEGYKRARTRGDWSVEVVYYPEGTPTFEYDDVAWIDTEANRLHCGMVQLDAECYPEDRNWYPVHETLRTARGRVLAKDAVIVQTEEGREVRMASEVQPDWARLHKSSNHPGMVIYALPGAPWGLTRSKTKVGLSTHPVVKLHDGSLEFTRNTIEVALPGGAGSARMHKDTTREQRIELARTRLKEQVDRWAQRAVDEALLTPRFLKVCVRNWTNLAAAPAAPNGTFAYKYIDEMTDPLVESIAAYEQFLEHYDQLGSYTQSRHPKDAAEMLLDVLRYAKEKRDEIAPPVEQPEETTERFVVAA